MLTCMVLWQEAGNNPVAALAAAEGLANADGLKSRGSIRIMSAVEEAQLAEERRIRRREQVRPASSLDVFSKAVRACLSLEACNQHSVLALSLSTVQEKERRKRCKLQAKGMASGSKSGTELKMVCGKCGAKGHMRTNKVRQP